MEEYPNFLEIQGNGTVDGHDGNGGYDRGKYWYAKKFLMPKKTCLYILRRISRCMANCTEGRKITFHLCVARGQ